MISSKTLAVGIVGMGCMVAGVGAYRTLRSPSAPSTAPTRLESPLAESAVNSTEMTVPAGPAVRAQQPKPANSIENRRALPERRPSDEVSSPAPDSARDKEPVDVPEVVDRVPAAAEVDAVPAVPVAPPPPAFTTLTVKSDSVIGIRLDAPVSSETARVEDPVTARVMRDVTVEGRVAVPEGARLEGTVTTVERGGKFKDRARIGIRFHTLVLADRSRIPIHTDAIFRDGEAPGGEAAAKVGASAVVAAILGGIIGGKKGAAIGTAAGAAGGTAAVMAGDPNPAVIPAGTPLTVRLLEPVEIEVARNE